MPHQGSDRGPRVRRAAFERATIKAMLGMYCRGVHGRRGGLCPECRGLLDYALKRISACPRLADKPVCSSCRVHCYGPGRREAVKAVMRWAGPRMPLRHPLMALAYMFLKAREPRT